MKLKIGHNKRIEQLRKKKQSPLGSMQIFIIFGAMKVHVLAGRHRKWSEFRSFEDTFLHLARSRVPGSLWKPHQSKAINFLHRSYVPTFFPTPTQKIFFSGWKKKLYFFSGKKYFPVFCCWNFREKKIGSNFSIFGKISKICFCPKKNQIFFFNPKKIIFVLELEKKLVHNFDVENW